MYLPLFAFESVPYTKTHCQLPQIPSEKNQESFALRQMSRDGSHSYVRGDGGRVEIDGEDNMAGKVLG